MNTFAISVVFLVFGCICLIIGGAFEYFRRWANAASARLEKLNTNPSLYVAQVPASGNDSSSSSSEEEIIAVGSHRMSRRPSRSRVLYAATPAVPAAKTAYGETSLAGTQVGQLPQPPLMAKRPAKPVLRDSTADLRIAGPGREILRPDYGELEVIPL